MSAVALITAAEARKLIGKVTGKALGSLPDFPSPVRRGSRRGPALYRRADVEAWERARIERFLAGRRFDDARPSVGTCAMSADGRVGLPIERAMVASMRRDLFKEDPLTAAPAPCVYWRALLSTARHHADGQDISPATLRAEAERDRARAARARPRLAVGHSPEVARPGAANIESSSRVPAPGRRGPTVQRNTLAGSSNVQLGAGP